MLGVEISVVGVICGLLLKLMNVFWFILLIVSLVMLGYVLIFMDVILFVLYWMLVRWVLLLVIFMKIGICSEILVSEGRVFCVNVIMV